ncbi:interleukin-4 [Chanodichthys erythropterus]|uniref:interleukin-4 n=1 Tax=Chanodichthys erythropterus TaxID=933992 RepID=UPI00351EC7E0
MRTFLLLALTFVAVNATQPDLKDLILDNIIAAVKHVLCHEDETLNHFVTDIFQNRKCTDKDICLAEKVMNGLNLKSDPLNLIWRNLYSYANITKHLHCKVTAPEQCPVKDFLKKLKDCCQSLRSKPKLHPKIVK